MKRRFFAGAVALVVGLMACSLAGCSLEVFDDDSPGGAAALDTRLQSLALSFGGAQTLTAARVSVLPPPPTGPSLADFDPAVFEYVEVIEGPIPVITATPIASGVTMTWTLLGPSNSGPETLPAGVPTQFQGTVPSPLTGILITVTAPGASTTTYTITLTGTPVVN